MMSLVIGKSKEEPFKRACFYKNKHIETIYITKYTPKIERISKALPSQVNIPIQSIALWILRQVRVSLKWFGFPWNKSTNINCMQNPSFVPEVIGAWKWTCRLIHNSKYRFKGGERVGGLQLYFPPC